MDMQIIVLGMHRSGTSMLSKVLSNLGIEMGSDGVGKEIYNIEGHYEDGEMLALNKEILSYLGGGWDNLPNEEIVNKNKNYILNKYLYFVSKKNGTWGVKEPRLSIFAHFLHQTLSNPKYIFMIRDELDVAKSLKARNNLTIKQGIELKYQYDEIIKSFLSDKEYLLIKYNELQSNPREELFRLSEFLGVEFNIKAISHISDRKNMTIKKKKFLRSYFICSCKALILRPHYILRLNSWILLKNYLLDLIQVYLKR